MHQAGRGFDEAPAHSEGVERPLLGAVSIDLGLFGVDTARGNGRDEPGLCEFDEVTTGLSHGFTAGPEGAGEKQLLLGSGRRHVDESALLGVMACVKLDLVGGELGVERLLRRMITPAQVGQLCPVTAEWIRQFAKPKPPRALARLGREGVLGEARDGDEVPFEALRAVNGEQLHSAVFRRFTARTQVVLSLGATQPAQKAAERALLVAVEKGADTVVEGIKVGQASPVGFIGDKFDIEQNLLFDEPHKVEQWQPCARSKPGKLSSSRTQTITALIAEPGELTVVFGGRRHEIKSVDQASNIVTGDGCPHPHLQLVAHGLLGPVARGEPGRHTGEGLQVSRSDAPAPTGQ